MAGRVFQLKATLVGTKPPVWRRVLVEESASLLDLHEVLQGAFGWYDCHLHEFEIDGVRYGTDDGEGWGPPPKSERRARLVGRDDHVKVRLGPARHGRLLPAPQRGQSVEQLAALLLAGRPARTSGDRLVGHRPGLLGLLLCHDLSVGGPGLADSI